MDLLVGLSASVEALRRYRLAVFSRTTSCLAIRSLSAARLMEAEFAMPGSPDQRA